MAVHIAQPTSTTLKWTVGVDEDDQATSDQFPVYQGDHSPFNQDGEVVSDPIPLQPNGQPWTWAAINALEDLKLEMEWDASTPADGRVRFNANRCIVEVFGPIGAVGPPVEIPGTVDMGNEVDTGAIGNVTARLGIGIISAKAKSKGHIIGSP